jgi:hypothetical protein
MGDLVLTLGAENLPNKDTTSKSDPFLVIFKVGYGLIKSSCMDILSEGFDRSFPVRGTDRGDRKQLQPQLEGNHHLRERPPRGKPAGYHFKVRWKFHFIPRNADCRLEILDDDGEGKTERLAKGVYRLDQLVSLK